MSKSLKNYEILSFVASPSDVANERTRLKSVIEDLNNGLANYLGIVIELKEWSQVAPNMRRGQQVIFDHIPVTSWDLMIGILWLRYGTPSGGANPSVQVHMKSSMQRTKCGSKMAKPRIMFYRCTRSLKILLNSTSMILQKLINFSKSSRLVASMKVYIARMTRQKFLSGLFAII